METGDGVIVLCPIWKVGDDTVEGIREPKKIISVLKSFKTSLFCTAQDLISLIQASILETADDRSACRVEGKVELCVKLIGVGN